MHQVHLGFHCLKSNKPRALNDISHMECQLTHSCDSYSYLQSCDKHCGIEENQHSLCRWLTTANHSARNSAVKASLSSVVVWPAESLWSQPRPRTLLFIETEQQRMMSPASHHISVIWSVTIHTNFTAEYGLRFLGQSSFWFIWKKDTGNSFWYVLGKGKH